MSSTQDALNSESLAPVQENQAPGGANEQREESKENTNNQLDTETKANSVPKKAKKTKKETKATAENGETTEKTNGAQDETANVQNVQSSESKGEAESKPIKKKAKKNSSKKEEENANQAQPIVAQENAENKDAKSESATPEGESAENKPKKKKKAVTKAAPTANEADNMKQETTEEAKKVEKTAPVSKPVEKATVKADSKPKESINLAKAEPQKPANLKEIAKQDAKEKIPVTKAEPTKVNPAKPVTNTVVEKAQVQPTETKANPKTAVAQKPNNVVPAPAQTTTEQAKPAKGGKTVVVKSQPEILAEKAKPVANEQAKKLESAEGSQANLNKKAKSPDSYKQAAKNLRSEKPQAPTSGTASGQKPKTAIEKQRIRSFDAGKTDKISADDSFETRSKLWEIRKKEKLLGQEKKKRKKEAAECTFTPQLNRNSKAKELPPGDIYERCSEWSSKVKESLAEKGEKIMEEARKPEMKKSRVKSAVGSKVFDPRVLRTTHDDLAAQYGTRRANLQYPQQHVLEIKDNVVDKVSEIREMYDVITSAIKNKSKRTIPQTSDPLKKHKTDLHGEIRASSATYSSQPKTAGVKSSPNAIKNDESSRLESLKGILNLKPTNKSSASGATKNGGTSEDQVYLSQSKNVDTLLKQDSKHLEIRNNRYVMVDNLPSTENRGVEGDDLSLNLESAEVL